MDDGHASTVRNGSKDLWRFIKFTLFSASAGIIQITSFTLLNEVARFSYWPAYLIALILSVIYNFVFAKLNTPSVIKRNPFRDHWEIPEIIKT